MIRVITLTSLLIALCFLCAEVKAATYTYSVTGLITDNDNYFIDLGAGAQTDPPITINAGDIINFVVNAPGHPFWVKTVAGTGTGNGYSMVTNNGAVAGTVVLTTDATTPSALYYQCEFHPGMVGVINVQAVVAPSTGTVPTPSSSTGTTTTPSSTGTTTTPSSTGTTTTPSSTGTTETPSSTGTTTTPSSTGTTETPSSTGTTETPSSTATETPSSTGSESSSGSDCGSETGGTETGGGTTTGAYQVPCPPGKHSATGYYDDGHEEQCPPCPVGTYTAGFGTIECTPCPAGTYVDNVNNVVCTNCPTHSMSLPGSTDRSQCICDVGFPGPIAGPCGYQAPTCNEDDEEKKPCPKGYEGPNGGPCKPCKPDTPSALNVTCSDATNKDECEAIDGCVALGGYRCDNGGKYRFVSCVPDAECAQVQTCATNDDTGVNSWFGTACIPDGYTLVDTTGSHTCCPPEECEDDKPAKSVGDDCTSHEGGSCCVLEFRGDCPNEEVRDIWCNDLVEDLAETCSRQSGIKPADLRKAIKVSVDPAKDGNDGASSFQCTLQLLPDTESGGVHVDAKELARALAAERTSRRENKRVSGSSRGLRTMTSESSAYLPLDHFQSVVAYSTFGTSSTSGVASGMSCSIILLISMLVCSLVAMF